MKSFIFPAWLLGAMALLQPPVTHAADQPIQLRGIVVHSGKAVALLEITNAISWRAGSFILGEGERDGDMEVTHIDAQAGSVKVRFKGTEEELGFSQPGSAVPKAAPALRFERTALPQALDIYAESVQRAILRPGSLPDIRLDLLCPNGSSNEATAKAIVAALAEKGILVRPDRNKFAVAVAKASDFEKITPQLWESSLLLGKREQIAPGGVINFPHTDLNQVLSIYEQLVSRTVLRPTTLPAPPIVFRTRTPLSLTEVVYALHATLALNDLSVIPAGKNFVVVVPTFQTNAVAGLLERVKPGPARNPMPDATGCTIRFARTTLSQVAAFYSDLAGQPVRIDSGTPEPVFFMKSPKALLPEEARYGIELLLGLNGLAFIPDDRGPGLKIVPSAMLGK